MTIPIKGHRWVSNFIWYFRQVGENAKRSNYYDKSSIQSIYEYALKLKGKSLSQVVELPSGIENSRNRGDLGSLIERYFFEHQPPNDHRPDFAEAGLELKTTGVRKTSNNLFKAKERLVLTMINYESVAKESWQT